MVKRTKKNTFPKTNGSFFVAGVDEAGRGPLAGPVVAAAVILKPGQKLPNLRDSKKLSEKQREILFEKITKNAITYAVTEVSNKYIDKNGLTKAVQKANNDSISKLDPQPSHVLFDGNDKQTTHLPYETIIKGDTFIREIMAASIIAKVTRDRKMYKLAKKHPLYRFEQHKGYGTMLHKALLKKHKPCELHRKSYTPVAEILSEISQEN